MSALPSPKIAIVGGGPAGLILARILLVNGIEPVVFELDEHALSRPQGGTLDLHEQTGQQAMRRAGLWDAFLKNAHYDAEDMIVTDRFGTRHVEILGQDTGRPEIDRTDLRQILLDSLPEGIVRWGKKLARAEVDSLHFSDGTSETGFDLIVGADGAWSKVRSLLTTVPPFYSGISGVDINILNVRERFPELSRRHGNGSNFIWGEENGQALLCQRCGDGSIRVYAFACTPEDWIKTTPIDFSDLAAARRSLCDMFSDFSDDALEYIRSADAIAPRALYQLPVGLQWRNRQGLTVIGDAAHVMTPFAGEGVNAAMTDAMQLAEAILKQPGNLELAVREYEAWMFVAARKVTQKTWNNMMEQFKEGAIASFKARVNGNLEQRQQK